MPSIQSHPLASRILPKQDLKMSRREKDQGFTLIEVLAALLIFSLSIVGLTHAGTQSAQAASYLEKKVLAAIVADNQLVLARLNLGTVEQSGTNEQMGRTFHFQVTTDATQLTGLEKLTVTVTAQDSSQVLITRTAFRPAQ